MVEHMIFYHADAGSNPVPNEMCLVKMTTGKIHTAILWEPLNGRCGTASSCGGGSRDGEKLYLVGLREATIPQTE